MLLQDTTNISHIIAGEILQLLWFLLAAIIIIAILPALRRKISDGESDLKVALPGGMEVSITKVREQVIDQITDLQNQVAEMKKNLNASSHQLLTTHQSQVRKQALLLKKFSKIMWVDDNPENNALIISKLSSDGFEILKTTSTKEALELYRKDIEAFDLLISDMGRKEMLKNNPTAGIDLIREVRKTEQLQKVPDDKRIPIIIYTTSKSVRQYRDSVVNEDGADAILSSPVELVQTIKLYCSDDFIN